ncbi:MAG: molybdenum cofactor guanylyltransferase [Anaerolineales bacterium]
MITIALQAGGKSTRMGKDKALEPFLGIPLIFRLKDRFLNIGEELVVITNDFSGYQDLHVPLYKDLIPDRGALGGLYTALAVTTTPILWLIAADLPFADPLLMTHLSKTLETSGADAVLPSTENGIEPFHAVYQVETCLPFVNNALDQDFWKMNSWHDQAKIQILTPAETRDNTTSEYTFWNLNTPEDFHSAEQEALKLNLV